MKQNAKSILQRVKGHYEIRTDDDLAEFLGIASGTIASWKSRDSLDEALLIAKCKDISLEWIFRGRGPVDFEDFIKTLKEDIGKTKEAPVVLTPIHDHIGAGNLVYFQEIGPTENTWVPKGLADLYPAMYYFRVEGWSMFPTVLPGAVIGLNTAEKNIISGEIYGIWFDHEGASIKYLFAQPGKFIIKADNPKYPDSEITVEELEYNERFIIGRLRYLSQIYK